MEQGTGGDQLDDRVAGVEDQVAALRQEVEQLRGLLAFVGEQLVIARQPSPTGQEQRSRR